MDVVGDRVGNRSCHRDGVRQLDVAGPRQRPPDGGVHRLRSLAVRVLADQGVQMGLHFVPHPMDHELHQLLVDETEAAGERARDEPLHCVLVLLLGRLRGGRVHLGQGLLDAQDPLLALLELAKEAQALRPGQNDRHGDVQLHGDDLLEDRPDAGQVSRPVPSVKQRQDLADACQVALEDLLQVVAARLLLAHDDAVLVVHEETHVQVDVLRPQPAALLPELQGVLDHAQLVGPRPGQEVRAPPPVHRRQGVDEGAADAAVARAGDFRSDRVVPEEEALLQVVERRVLLPAARAGQVRELLGEQVGDGDARLPAQLLPQALLVRRDLPRGQRPAPAPEPLERLLVVGRDGDLEPLQLELLELPPVAEEPGQEARSGDKRREEQEADDDRRGVGLERVPDGLLNVALTGLPGLARVALADAGQAAPAGT
mmetsp:Transcript_45249/g.119540  ORF Transcript_45249/g.119540 Transcript_45249/m.119540 type:complete len:428 (-) Transcript_45249:1737-3020(-)